MTAPAGGDAPPPPAAAALLALSSDDWASLLVATRSELASRDELPSELERLRATPAGRLASGEGRDAVVAALTADTQLWAAVADRLPDELRAQLTVPVGRATAPHRESGEAATVAQLRQELERARRRARSLREERDAWQRRTQACDARAARAEAALAAEQQARHELEEEVVTLRAAQEAAERARERAVARERRRQDSERERLARENTALRRAEQERRAVARRRVEAEERRAPAPVPEPTGGAVPQVPAGRPTALPDDLVPGTTPWAQALLGPGRLVLVDGYNVTRQHRPDLDLAAQRDWLVRLLTAAVAVHGWRSVLVFDGQEAGGARPRGAGDRIEVRFTAADITADDELVLAVEGTDEPVVVVTDDRELADRVRASDADVVGTTAFLSVART